MAYSLNSFRELEKNTEQMNKVQHRVHFSERFDFILFCF